MWEALGFAELCSVQLEFHELLCLLTVLPGWECLQSSNAAASCTLRHCSWGLLPVMQQIPIISVPAYKGSIQVFAGRDRELTDKGCDNLLLCLSCAGTLLHNQWTSCLLQQRDSRWMETDRSAWNTKKPWRVAGQEPSNSQHLSTEITGEEQGFLEAWDVRASEQQTHLDWCTKPTWQIKLCHVWPSPAAGVQGTDWTPHEGQLGTQLNDLKQKGRQEWGLQGRLCCQRGAGEHQQHIPKSSPSALTNWSS